VNGFGGKKPVPLWLLCVPVAAWGLHFLAVYVAAAVYCAKAAGLETALDTPTATAHWSIVAITLPTLAIYAFAAWRGYAGVGRPVPGCGEALPGQGRFLGSIVLMLSGLSAAATIVVASAAFFFGDCR
jgi:hypothetical protein